VITLSGQGVRHRTGRVARFVAQTENVRRSISCQLVPPSIAQHIDFINAYFGTNRLWFTWTAAKVCNRSEM
jgi:hypothetical protein